MTWIHSASRKEDRLFANVSVKELVKLGLRSLLFD